jgi:hypothetical protein
MIYVNPDNIRDFYSRSINAKPLYVYLRMTESDWQLIGVRDDKPPARAALVGRFTVDINVRAFADDVQETAHEMARVAA